MGPDQTRAQTQLRKQALGLCSEMREYAGPEDGKLVVRDDARIRVGKKMVSQGRHGKVAAFGEALCFSVGHKWGKGVAGSAPSAPKPRERGHAPAAGGNRV